MKKLFNDPVKVIISAISIILFAIIINFIFDIIKTKNQINNIEDATIDYLKNQNEGNYKLNIKNRFQNNKLGDVSKYISVNDTIIDVEIIRDEKTNTTTIIYNDISGLVFDLDDNKCFIINETEEKIFILLNNEIYDLNINAKSVFNLY